MVAVAGDDQRPRRLLRGRLKRAGLRHERGRGGRRLVDRPRGGRSRPARHVAAARPGRGGRGEHEHQLPRGRGRPRRRAAGGLRGVVLGGRRVRSRPPGARRGRHRVRRPAVARSAPVRARFGARPRGRGVAERALLAAPQGVWHAPITGTPTELTDDVLEARLEQGRERGPSSSCCATTTGATERRRQRSRWRPAASCKSSPGTARAQGSRPRRGRASGSPPCGVAAVKGRRRSRSRPSTAGACWGRRVDGVAPARVGGGADERG